jgi:hypothetical protein
MPHPFAMPCEPSYSMVDGDWKVWWQELAFFMGGRFPLLLLTHKPTHDQNTANLPGSTPLTLR